MWSVIGQTRTVSLLERSLATGSVAHAYLFTGPAHVGKTTLALSLAQALNCEGAKRPCGECLSCQKIASAKHSDVQVIVLNDETSEEKRAKIGVDQIEELQHSASLPPFEGRYKVFIIDGAESLSIGAANRLLKTLEEPVGRVVFILLTVDDRLLPATVISRCQRLELFPMPASQIETALKTNWSVEPEQARLLARVSHGCLGWAVSAARDDTVMQRRAEWMDRLLEIISGDSEERFAHAAQMAAQFTQDREAFYGRLKLWLDWWRDLLLVKVGSVDNITNIDQLGALSDTAKVFNLAQIRTFIQSIRAVGEQLRQNANPRLALEVFVLGVPEMGKYGESEPAV
jgi:DNA polymerase-3 subunit delta'